MSEPIDLERRGWEALSTEGAGRPFYADVLADEVLMQLPGGMVIADRAAALDAMSGEPWSSHTLDDVTSRVLGADVALVTYGVVATRGDTTYSALIVSVYLRRPSGWRLVFHQQTPR